MENDEIIGLKAPGNCMDQFWSNKISVLLCEEPKPQVSMISGLLSPRESLFIDLNIPNYFRKYEKIMRTFCEYASCKFENLEIRTLLEFRVPEFLKN